MVTRCPYCEKPVQVPSALCSVCGGPLADAGMAQLGVAGPFYASANDDALGISVDLGDEFTVVPLGNEDAVEEPRPAYQRAAF